MVEGSSTGPLRDTLALRDPRLYWTLIWAVAQELTWKWVCQEKQKACLAAPVVKNRAALSRPIEHIVQRKFASLNCGPPDSGLILQVQPQHFPLLFLGTPAAGWAYTPSELSSIARDSHKFPLILGQGCP